MILPCTCEWHTHHPPPTWPATPTHRQTDRQTTSNTLGVCVTHLYKENQYLHYRYSWEFYICPFRFGIQRVFIRQFFDHYSFCNHPCCRLPIALCQDLHVDIKCTSIVVLQGMFMQVRVLCLCFPLFDVFFSPFVWTPSRLSSVLFRQYPLAFHALDLVHTSSGATVDVYVTWHLTATRTVY